MKNAHIRVLVILAILSLVGIIGTQVFWLNRAIAQQDRVFNHNVQVALRNVVESLCEASGKDFPSANPIEQVSGNYFIVRTNDRIDLANLEYLISAEIKKRAISEDFEYGVYDCANDQMVYAENVNLHYASERDPIPVLKNDEYYFGVYFPNKSRNLFAGFDLWKFTTAISLVVILFFGYALFVILRQKRLSEVQKDFINNVSHELKTPLATLSLASDTLGKRSSEKEQKYVGIIQKEVGRLQKNVEDILHSARLESNIQVSREEVDLNVFFDEIINEIKDEHASQMIEWSINIMAPKPVQSNPKLLENILRNLLDNAIKYGARKIKLDIEQMSKNTTISIVDDGFGIAPEFKNKIFRKFFRVPEASHQHNQKGFGLGLHIVSSLVKKLGGKITVESEVGKGSTFKIKFPNG